MAKKPTCEELEQRVKELEREAIERNQTEKALIDSKNRTFQLKARPFPPRFTLTVSLVLATCIIFIVGHLLGKSWFKLQESLPHHTTIRGRVASQPDGSDRLPAIVKPVVYPQGLPDPEEGSKETEDMSMPETFSSQQGLYDKAISAAAHMPEPKADPSTTGRVVIQVGAYRKKANAELLLRELEEKGYDAYLDKRIVQNLGLLYQVRLRGYASESAAGTAMAQLRKQEGLNDSFTLTVDGAGRGSQAPALQ